MFDFVDDGEILAIVQEHVAGQTLDELLETQGAQPPDWAVRILDQLASALGQAHERGLAHRDIKPSNILITQVNGQPTAKITDFGIAKVLGAEKMRTATGAKMGTLAYMSPEHVKSPKLVDQRSDIYSLGAVLYEMLTGRPAFQADTEYELMSQIVSQPPPRPSLAAEGVPSGLDAVAQQAMAKQPEKRFQSCEALRRALGCVRESKEIFVERKPKPQSAQASKPQVPPPPTAWQRGGYPGGIGTWRP